MDIHLEHGNSEKGIGGTQLLEGLGIDTYYTQLTWVREDGVKVEAYANVREDGYVKLELRLRQRVWPGSSNFQERTIANHEIHLMIVGKRLEVLTHDDAFSEEGETRGRDT